MSKKYIIKHFPQLRNDQYKLILHQQGISQILFSRSLGKQSNYANGILTRQPALAGVEFTTVPDFFIRKLIKEVGESYFWTSAHHWNNIHPELPIEIPESDS